MHNCSKLGCSPSSCFHLFYLHAAFSNLTSIAILFLQICDVADFTGKFLQSELEGVLVLAAMLHVVKLFIPVVFQWNVNVLVNLSFVLQMLRTGPEVKEREELMNFASSALCNLLLEFSPNKEVCICGFL